MKFGVGILGSEPADETIKLVRTVEKLGYDFAWIPDEKFYRDCYAQLMLCALHSKKLKMGTCVTDPYIRSPVITAAAIATIADASKGRAVLGIGAGGAPQLRSIGIEQKHPAQSIREAVEIIRLLLKSDKAIDYNGEIAEIRNVKLNFECDYDIPIYIASRGPKTLQLAGEVGDGAIIGSLSSQEGIRYALKNIRAGADLAKRSLDDIDIVSWVYCSIGHTEDVKESVKPIIAASIYNSRRILQDIGIDPQLARPIIETVEKHRGAPIEAAKHVTEELRRKFSVAGTPEECRRQVEELASADIDQVAIVPHASSKEGNKKTIELFARQVMNRFR